MNLRTIRVTAVGVLAAFAVTAVFAGAAGAAVTPTIPIFKPPTNWQSKITKFNSEKAKPFNLSTFAKWMPTQVRTIKMPANVNLDFLSTVDLTANAEPVGNQANINSCASWAIGYGLAGWWVNKLGKFAREDWFNPMSVYGAVSNHANVGTSPSDNFNRIKTIGITRESDYTVDDWTFTHVSNISELILGVPYRFTNWSNLYFSGANAPGSNAVTALKDILWRLRVPVAISAHVYTGFGGTGTYVKGSGATFRGNHEMLAVGYNSGGLLVQNSWGTGWGNSGYIRLGWDYVKSDVYAADYATGMN